MHSNEQRHSQTAVVLIAFALTLNIFGNDSRQVHIGIFTTFHFIQIMIDHLGHIKLLNWRVDKNIRKTFYTCFWINWRRLKKVFFYFSKKKTTVELIVDWNIYFFWKVNLFSAQVLFSWKFPFWNFICEKFVFDLQLLENISIYFTFAFDAEG